MKKLIAALAICVGTAAFANNTNDKAQQQQEAQQTKSRDATQVFTQQPGDSIHEAEQKANKGLDATEVGPEISKTAKKVTGVQTESEGTFKTAQAFTLTGTLKDKTMEGVTIERKGLPAADLDIRDKTALYLDGKKVDKDALPEGAQVRAKFQLEGQDIVAVELKATSPKGGTGGAGLGNDAKNVGKGVESGAKSAGHAVESGAKSTGHAVESGAKSAGHAVKKGAEDVGNEVKNSTDDTSDDINNPQK